MLVTESESSFRTTMHAQWTDENKRILLTVCDRYCE